MSDFSEDIPPPRLWREFLQRAESNLDRTAVVTPSSQATFGELFSQTESLARQLTDAGVKPGQVVGYALPNSVDFIIAFLALCRLSAVTSLISTKYQTSELAAILGGVSPDYLLTSQNLARNYRHNLPSLKTVATLPGTGEGPLVLLSPEPSGNGKADHSWRSFDCQESEQPALIKFTSGSTGVPKAILLSVGNVMAEAENVVNGLKLTPRDRILSAVPAFHSYGFDLGVMATLWSGACLELREIFIPRRILSDITRREITVFLGVPSMYRFFLETRLEQPPDLSHLRYPLSCTAPLDPEVIKAFYVKFGATICQHYGSSESGGVTTHLPDQVAARSDSVGRGMPGVEIGTVDANGEPLARGVEGEVVISGPAVARRYIMGQPEGRSPIRDGKYFTGDIGKIDEQGFLYVAGRIDKLINVGGLKVSPEEVGRVLESCPTVREAAVAGVRDGNNEEVVFAVVTLRSPAGENDILEYCRGRLAEYKIPRRIDIREEMPRTATGKVRLGPEDLRL